MYKNYLSHSTDVDPSVLENGDAHDRAQNKEGRNCKSISKNCRN